MFFAKIRHSLLMVFSLVSFAGMALSYAHAQSDNFPRDIDLRLIEVVEEVRLRARAPKSVKQDQGNSLSDENAYAERRIQAAVRIQEAAYSKDINAIRKAISEFSVIDNPEATPSMANITNLYSRYASLLEKNATLKTQQLEISIFEETGSWVERYFALHLSWYLHMASNDRQAALQKAQYGFRLISDDSGQEIYRKFAKAEVLSTLSHLHNRQGNVDLAIASSLEYLKLTRGDKDAKVAIDILNNLIFSHSLTRDHKSLNYLSGELLEIEKLSPPSILGLSALRASQVANIGGNFEKGYLFSQQAIEKTSHSTVKEQAIISQAVSLAGLGRKDEVQSLILNSDLNLDREHLLNTERRRDVIYLGFLLAQGKDEVLARQLYNRHLDVAAQKFYENSSQDTTAMVAELENSRERQAERDAAAARESRLQALTIDKQRKLNRTLKIISILLGGAALASFFFMKFRVRIVGELEEKTIEAASAEKLKTEFLGMISHELRTPLNGIIGISDFLANYHQDPDIRSKTGVVLQSGQELLAIVESLTDMARLDAGQLVLVPHDADLARSLPTVSDAYIERAEKKGLAFTRFVDPAISEHHVDEDRLLQVLKILLCNATRFTQSGRVHLHVTANYSADKTVTGLTAIVADTGQGMNEDVLSRLFTPFMQADTSRKRTHMGTGLSLAIAYGLAEVMEGTLSVFSREGRGSEFKLDIPLAPAKAKHRVSTSEASAEQSFETDETEEPPSLAVAPPAKDIPKPEVIDLMVPHAARRNLHEAAPAPRETADAPEHQRILVIDPDEAHRHRVLRVLKGQGHSCDGAGEGFAALELLNNTAFDVLVLDVEAVAMGGLGTLKRIRRSGQAYANIPVIIMSADRDARAAAACKAAGANLFLSKPVRLDELSQMISYLHLDNQPARLSR